jgi:hypothetical protein
MPSQLDPAAFARSIIVESADIPEGMTIAEWRRARAAVRPVDRRRRVARRRTRRNAPAGAGSGVPATG